MADLIQELEKEQLRDDNPDFAPGDTVRILYLVREGAKVVAADISGAEETTTLMTGAASVEIFSMIGGSASLGISPRMRLILSTTSSVVCVPTGLLQSGQ